MPKTKLKIPKERLPNVPIAHARVTHYFIRHGEWDKDAEPGFVEVSRELTEGVPPSTPLPRGWIKFHDQTVLESKANEMADDVELRINQALSSNKRHFVIIRFDRGQEPRDDASMRIFREQLKTRLVNLLYKQRVNTPEGPKEAGPFVFIGGYHPFPELRGVSLMKIRDDLVRIAHEYAHLKPVELKKIGLTKREALARAATYRQFEGKTDAQMRELRKAGVYRDEFWYREANLLGPGLGPHDMAAYLGGVVKSGTTLVRRALERRQLVDPVGHELSVFTLHFGHTSFGALPWSLRGRTQVPDMRQAEHYTVTTELNNQGRGVLQEANTGRLDFNGRMTIHSLSDIVTGGVPREQYVAPLVSAPARRRPAPLLAPQARRIARPLPPSRSEPARRR